MNDFGNVSDTMNNTCTTNPFDPLFAISCILIVTTIVGNTMVIVAFCCEAKLKSLTNYWIISLSVTDIILASFVMPLSAIKDIANGGCWLYHEIYCEVFISLDILCCTCSIYHLCLISIDRFCLVKFPMNYTHRRTLRATLIAIVLTWIGCLFISSARLIFNWTAKQLPNQCDIVSHSYRIFSSLLSYFIPFCVIITMYVLIYHVTRKQVKKFSKARPDETSYLSVKRNTELHMACEQRPQPILVVESETKHFDERIDKLENGTPHVVEVEVGYNPKSCYQPTENDEINLNSSLMPDMNRLTLPSKKSHSVDPSTSNPPHDNSIESDIDQEATSMYDNGKPSGLQFSFQKACMSAHQIMSGSKSPKSQKVPPAMTTGLMQAIGYLYALPHSQTSDSINSHSMSSAFDLSEITSPRNMFKPEQSPRSQFLGTNVNVSLKEKRLTRSREKQEQRAAKIVLIVVGSFIIFWTPFFVCNSLPNNSVPPTVFLLVTWLGYCNSVINPFIYTFFNRTFRRTIYNIVTCKLRACRRVKRNWTKKNTKGNRVNRNILMK